MNNALFVIHSIIHSIVQQNYSFKEFIHSKKHANYSFKDFIHSKKIQNNSFKKFIHSRKSKIIHSKKIFMQVKNGLSPMASPDPPKIKQILPKKVAPNGGVTNEPPWGSTMEN